MLGVLAAFFAAALSGMGVGGGGLFLIYLTFVSDVSQHEAQFTNLCFFLLASASALLLHLQKRKLPLLAVALLSLGGVAGAFFGSLMAAKLGSEALRVVLGVFFAFSGLVSFFKRKRRDEK